MVAVNPDSLKLDEASQVTNSYIYMRVSISHGCDVEGDCGLPGTGADESSDAVKHSHLYEHVLGQVRDSHGFK
jgi:hypothetical protein